ncbi:hypothetical protein INT43_001653 [Umbelopsis isabellina]|uniref:Uncharacterized protein n=1 Tax=Mortierella isabellina TaxID=91625 RepID=A0A8H7UEM4_MORIS|nr:hypothetical protein INT43_001653 [Umbelopsis isabellina]
MKFSREHDFPASQLVPLHVDPQNLQGKTLLITGANTVLPTGLGLESAKQLAKMRPAKLILACRNMESAGKAVESIKAEGVNDVEAWEFDQSSIAGVNAFTKRYNESGLDLHVILANAGILPLNPTETPVLNKDGNEVILATNHLGTSLLILGLLPSVRRTAAKGSKDQFPRIVVVSSNVHHWTEFLPSNEDGNVIKAMNNQKAWTSTGLRYFDTKLLNIFFAHELGRKLQQSKVAEDKNIVVSIVNPGLVMPQSVIDDPNSQLNAIQRKYARDYPEGCKTHVFATVDPSAGKPGDVTYYTNCAPQETGDITLGKDGETLRERVWRDTLEVLGVNNESFQL